MSIEQQLREQFDHATEHLGSADLDVVLGQGRRHRRRRIGTIAVGSVAAAGAVALAVTPFVHDRVAAKPMQPASQSKHVVNRAVSTNPVAKRLQAAVAAAAPELPAPTEVYPSDWNRNTPLPAGQAANATDWELVYKLPHGETVRVVSGLQLPGRPERGCDPPTKGTHNEVGASCTQRQVAGGLLVRQQSQNLDQATMKPTATVFLSSLATKDRVFSAIETVPNADAQAAAKARAMTDAQLDRIATAHGLDIPQPAVTPAPPTGP